MNQGLLNRVARLSPSFHRCNFASVVVFSPNRPTTIVRKISSSTFQRQCQQEEFEKSSLSPRKLKIVRYPHPSLRRINSDVTLDEIKDGSIVDLAREMLEMMYESNGVGLAAPQVGINKRLIVYNQTGLPEEAGEEVILINPKIVEFGRRTEIDTEGCLSIPGLEGDVQRSTWIKMEATILPRLTGGEEENGIRKITGWEARIFQHEFDHLEGTLFIDKLDDIDLQEGKPILDQLEKEFRKVE